MSAHEERFSCAIRSGLTIDNKKVLLIPKIIS